MVGMNKKPLGAKGEEMVRVMPTLYPPVKSKDSPNSREWFGQCQGEA